MKRIVCLLAAVLLVCAMMPVATAEGEVTLRLVGNLEPAQVGDTVTVTAVAENAPDCTSYSLTFLYDATVLKPISAQKGQTEGLAEFALNTSFEGKPAVHSTALNPVSVCFSGDATLATFTFEVIGETPGLYGTPLKICLSYFTSDAVEGSAFGHTRKHGRVYVGADEVPSTAQAVELLRHLIGFPLENAESMDCDLNGSLSVADAVLLLRELN